MSWGRGRLACMIRRQLIAKSCGRDARGPRIWPLLPSAGESGISARLTNMARLTAVNSRGLRPR
jgi:hypothetical protein